MKYEIDTTKILNQLIRYVWVMILAFAVGATGGYTYVNNIKPNSYNAQLSLVINSQYDSPTGVNVAKNIIKTAVTVIRSETFINSNIRDKAGIDKTASEVKSMTRFSIEEDALIAYIRVTGDTPEEAYDIAKAFFDADYSYINEKVDGCNVATVDPPVLPQNPNAKNSTYTGFMTGLISAILSAVAIVLITIFDTRIKIEDDLTGIRGEVPIIGVIPSFNQPSSGYGKHAGYAYEYDYGYGYGYARSNSATSSNKVDEVEGGRNGKK